MGIFYIKIQQILLIWFSEPDTEPKIAAEPGSAEPVSRYVLTLGKTLYDIFPQLNWDPPGLRVWKWRNHEKGEGDRCVH